MYTRSLNTDPAVLSSIEITKYLYKPGDGVCLICFAVVMESSRHNVWSPFYFFNGMNLPNNSFHWEPSVSDLVIKREIQGWPRNRKSSLQKHLGDSFPPVAPHLLVPVDFFHNTPNDVNVVRVVIYQVVPRVGTQNHQSFLKNKVGKCLKIPSAKRRDQNLHFWRPTHPWKKRWIVLRC